MQIRGCCCPYHWCYLGLEVRPMSDVVNVYINNGNAQRYFLFHLPSKLLRSRLDIISDNLIYPPIPFPLFYFKVKGLDIQSSGVQGRK